MDPFIVQQQYEADHTVMINGVQCTARYVLMTKADLEALKTDDEVSDIKLLKKHLKNLTPLADPDGNPIEFNEQVLEALCEHRFIERALALGLLNASRAGPVKNSQSGPAG